MTTTVQNHLELRHALVAASAQLFTSSSISRSGHANLSARVSATSMLLTVKGHVRNLTVDDLALVGFDGRVLEGSLDPTNAEIVAMHTKVYEARAEVGGIIHTHAANLLSFALANRALPCRYEALLRYGQAEDVPVVPWAPRGSDRSVGGIVDALEANPGTWAVLLGNHGVLVFGRTPEEAAGRLGVLEEAAEAELAATALGGATDLPAGALSEIRAAMAKAGSTPA